MPFRVECVLCGADRGGSCSCSSILSVALLLLLYKKVCYTQVNIQSSAYNKVCKCIKLITV